MILKDLKLYFDVTVLVVGQGCECKPRCSTHIYIVSRGRELLQCLSPLTFSRGLHSKFHSRVLQIPFQGSPIFCNHKPKHRGIAARVPSSFLAHQRIAFLTDALDQISKQSKSSCQARMQSQIIQASVRIRLQSSCKPSSSFLPRA